jgi:uncharacterized protein
MKKIDLLVAALVVIGALNWGLVGLFHFDPVAAIFGQRFGETNAISSVVYTLVGIAGCTRVWPGRRYNCPGTAIIRRRALKD